MALDFMENFEDWGSTLSAANAGVEGWTLSGTSGLSFVSGARVGSRAIKTGSSSTMKRAVAAGSTKYFSARLYIDPSAISSTRSFFTFREAAIVHTSIGLTSTYKIVALRNLVTTLGTESGTRTVGAWFQLTGKVVIHDTAGSIEVRLNGDAGSPLLNLTGIDTRNGGTGVIDQVEILIDGANGAAVSLHDLAVWSDSGDAPNGWLGDVRVDSYNVSAAGSSTQFTPSAGANYECVDETLQDSDTTYVESATNGHIDLYAVENMAHTPTEIHAVMVTALARKTDTGSGSLKAKSKSGATTSTGSTVALADASYGRVTLLHPTDPNTAAAWTKSGVDALEAGFEAVI